ncbi:MAG TPA: Mur ligase family protein, partial [Bacteroidales bacterium]|nr:Mur ligase family protein [Bacteroidales bacterium]
MEEALSLIYNQFLRNPSVVIDSRKVKPGDLFFALKGDRFDGNRFAAEVIASGAAMAVVDDSSLINEKGCIWVEDTLKALQLLANRYRNSLNVIVIGITGSNGKTTTKELIAKTLSENYNVLATEGNLNNHIGVPLTLLKLKKETQIAVIEMGANHPGEIDALCKIAEPGYGIITNIGRAHLEGFGGFEGVIRTKTEMYRY